MPSVQEKRHETRKIECSEITDLCQWIKNVQATQPNDDELLGYLSDAGGTRYGLYSVNIRHDVEPPILSFHVGGPLAPSKSPSKAIVQPNRQSIPQSIKHQLAFTLGSTMLQLHSTPWLDKWAKQDIVYLPEPESDAIQSPVRPYISRRISTGKDSKAASTSPFQIQLAQFVPNETLFTLGIVLIEIAYNKPIEDLAEPIDGTPDVAPYMTAMRLRKQIQGEMGPRYQRAVTGCLVCDFGVANVDVDLKDVEIQRKFLELVVVPLEESMDFFSSSTRLA